jgi:CO/xanthine dehydrogenase FAD-binding subunit
MKLRLARPEHLVDLQDLEELCGKAVTPASSRVRSNSRVDGTLLEPGAQLNTTE